ncbi:LysR family transcriptional regulator [Nonomuraea roseoviolacea]|uniref:DNA-binding transcriptional LysR family regulator n=1 Tax=Nonomuraea roseoviolacea subsp. carminata TaxID=160689 RepID=A0ABT1K7I9_9ACTN|nr:LysR family transcriptional regulator [Nonomuraea roseoviolacea]MCP2349961.1 DNA-binding transcriptional LysR family regulator [Nonomuraea roseoviolacea subsp. carminata]
MELRQLAYFVAVAEEGGFGRAAERLSIVQSAVSQQVRRLERELGVSLFTRTTRRVHLSGAGERLLPEARAVLAAAHHARQVAADVRAGSDGVLRLGIVQGPGDRVYRTLGALADVAPRLQVRPRRLPLPDRLAAVRSGELDAALVRALTDAPGLELLPVWTDPLYVALPAEHPLARPAETWSEEPAGYPLARPAGARAEESVGHPSARPAAAQVEEPTRLPSARSAGLRIEDLAGLPLRLAPREGNPPFHDLIIGACRAAGVSPPLGPPFTTLQETLTDIGVAAPSWTVFYEVAGLPDVPRVAVRPLAGHSVTTSLAVLPGVPAPAVRHLLHALTRVA